MRGSTSRVWGLGLDARRDLCGAFNGLWLWGLDLGPFMLRQGFTGVITS